jgi:hypothetical protein
MPRVTIDVISHTPDGQYWTLTLVEEGPWPLRVQTARLRHLQDRLYSAFDAVVDGNVAAKYPDSTGKHFIIRVDCYDLADSSVRPFFNRFASHIASSQEHQQALSLSPHSASLSFELSFDSLPRRPHHRGPAFVQ